MSAYEMCCLWHVMNYLVSSKPNLGKLGKVKYTLHWIQFFTLIKMLFVILVIQDQDIWCLKQYERL